MLVSRIVDGAEMYVSFVYGENNSRARMELWKVLSNHKVVVGNYPWLMPRDFNVILNFSEHSNIRKVNTDRCNILEIVWKTQAWKTLR